MAALMRVWALVVLVSAACSAAQAKPVALILANSSYQAIPSLDNPANDAILAQRVFEAYDFDIEVVTDGSAEAMRAALAAFRRKSENADMAVIYYAGHGIQANNINYLLPVDVGGGGQEAITDGSLTMAELFDAFAPSSTVKLLLMDACRDNPFEGGGSASAGLARANHEVSDLLVVYAAQPNRVALDGEGTNSPFMIAIAETLAANPSVQLNDALIDITNHVRTRTLDQQLPYIEGSLSLHVKLARGTDIDTDISGQVGQCTGTALSVPFAKTDVTDLDLDDDIRVLRLQAAQRKTVNICRAGDRLRIEGPFAAEFSADQLLEAKSEGIGYYFSDTGLPSHLWLTMDAQDPDSSVEIGLYQNSEQLLWVTTPWRLPRN